MKICKTFRRNSRDRVSDCFIIFSNDKFDLGKREIQRTCTMEGVNERVRDDTKVLTEFPRSFSGRGHCEMLLLFDSVVQDLFGIGRDNKSTFQFADAQFFHRKTYRAHL